MAERLSNTGLASKPGFLFSAFVVVFIFCNTTRERGGEGPEPGDVPGTASEADFHPDLYRKGNFGVHTSGNSRLSISVQTT